MDHYKIYDEDGKILVSDIVISSKNDIVTFFKDKENCDDNIIKKILKINLISFDSKYFLNTNCFRCELVKSQINTETDYHFDKIKFDIKNFSKYRIVKWIDVAKDNNAPIYRDYGYDELDPEVESLVQTLNSIPSILTTSSCSGHGEKNLFILMNIYDYDTIMFLTNIINTHFCNDFYLGTTEMLYNPKFYNTLFFSLVSKSIGEEAYNKAKELAKVIEDNKTNIYPKFTNDFEKFDGRRVQVLDVNGNILADDIVRKTFRSLKKEQYDQGYIHKTYVKDYCYISFDEKHYIDINSKFFVFNFFELTEVFENDKFNKVEFNIEKFKSYRINDIKTINFSNSPICIDYEFNNH